MLTSVTVQCKFCYYSSYKFLITPGTMGETFEAGSWNVETEVNLFHAMRGHKPVGVNRHFHMVVIHDKLSSPATKKLTAKNVWDHLSTMYDLQALNESEILPFPNKPINFELPERDYEQLCEADFPRMRNVITASPVEETKAKPEGQAKGGKSSRSDSKTSQASKTDTKSSSTPSEGTKAHSSRPESKSGAATSGRGEGKGGGKGGHMAAVHAASTTPDPSPKRTKRTRNTHSATNSPSLEAPPSKRRRL